MCGFIKTWSNNVCVEANAQNEDDKPIGRKCLIYIQCGWLTNCVEDVMWLMINTIGKISSFWMNDFPFRGLHTPLTRGSDQQIKDGHD